MKDLLRAIADHPTDLPIERARTIPREWYLDPQMLALEKRAVFRRSWQVVARTDELVDLRSYVSTEVAGEPVLLVRNAHGSLRGFVNACRHKGTRILPPGGGSCASLRCRYHGWTYDLDGALRGAPECNGQVDFARSDHGLLPIAVDVFGPFVFASLAPPAEPLRDALGPLYDQAEPLLFDRLRFSARRTYDLACNWKVFVDNYLDGGYHVSTVHPELAAQLDYSRYTTECFAKTSLQSSPFRASGENEASGRAFYWWLWPNFMINVYDGLMDTNLVLPLGPESCRVHIDFWFAPDSPEAHQEKSVAAAHTIQQEDIGVSEEVQRGLQSESFSSGRFCAAREVAVFHFQRLLVAALRTP